MPFYETADRVRLYYEVQGGGAPMLFIHGLTANHRHFRYQVSGLRDTFRTVVYDLRGHGASETGDRDLHIGRLAGDLRELIDYLNLSPVTLVGWSLGAHVAFEFIRRFGCGDIRNLAIIDMAPRLMKTGPAEPEPWENGLRGFSGRFGDFGHEDNTRILAAINETDWTEYSGMLVERLYDRALMGNGRFDDDADVKGKGDIGWLREEANRNRPYVVAALWASMAVRDYRDLLDQISCPALIAYGEGSNYYPKESSEYMHSRLRQSSLVAFPGCGHALHIQDPDMFNRVLRRHTQECL